MTDDPYADIRETVDALTYDGWTDGDVPQLLSIGQIRSLLADHDWAVDAQTALAAIAQGHDYEGPEDVIGGHCAGCQPHRYASAFLAGKRWENRG